MRPQTITLPGPAAPETILPTGAEAGHDHLRACGQVPSLNESGASAGPRQIYRAGGEATERCGDAAVIGTSTARAGASARPRSAPSHTLIDDWTSNRSIIKNRKWRCRIAQAISNRLNYRYQRQDPRNADWGIRPVCINDKQIETPRSSSSRLYRRQS